MAHGKYCGCVMCSMGKKVGMIKDEHKDEHHDEHGHSQGKTYVCQSCGSESANKPGTCCGSGRQEA